MDLPDFLNSLNQNKKNLLRTTDSPDSASKMYGKLSYIVARLLSHHADAVLFVNELNVRGSPEFKLSPRQHYEYLLYSLRKGSRFSKLDKVQENQDVEMLMELNSVSRVKALEILSLLTEDQLRQIRDSRYTGGDGGSGVDTPKRRKRT